MNENNALRRSLWLRRFFWIVGLFALLAAGAVYFYFRASDHTAPTTQTQNNARRGANNAGRNAMPVVAAPARLDDVKIYLNGLGSVQAFNTVTVKVRADGQLMKVFFREGQFV